jgi:hypothetical protein
LIAGDAAVDAVVLASRHCAHGVRYVAREFITYAVVITMILGSALAACLLPACRAASADAAVTLRTQ